MRVAPGVEAAGDSLAEWSVPPHVRKSFAVNGAPEISRGYRFTWRRA